MDVLEFNNHLNQMPEVSKEQKQRPPSKKSIIVLNIRLTEICNQPLSKTVK